MTGRAQEPQTKKDGAATRQGTDTARQNQETTPMVTRPDSSVPDTSTEAQPHPPAWCTEHLGEGLYSSYTHAAPFPRPSVFVSPYWHTDEGTTVHLTHRNRHGGHDGFELSLREARGLAAMLDGLVEGIERAEGVQS